MFDYLKAVCKIYTDVLYLFDILQRKSEHCSYAQYTSYFKLKPAVGQLQAEEREVVLDKIRNIDTNKGIQKALIEKIRPVELFIL